MFIIIKSAGNHKGRIKSVHRSYQAAVNAQPAVFYALVNTKERVRVGDVRPDLLTR